MNMRTAILMFGVAFTAMGCNAYRLRPPPAGFAEVSSDTHQARFKAGDNVGLSVRVFDNVRGGTLAFWGEDLVRKLAQRGYTLVHHEPVHSKNRKEGTRFDFSYQARDGVDKFYSVMLFVTDKHRIVVDMAGDESFAARYESRLRPIASETTVRGCRPWGKLCNGDQPRLELAVTTATKDPAKSPDEAAPAPVETPAPSPTKG